MNQPQRLQLMRKRSLILVKYFPSNRVGQVVVAREIQVESCDGDSDGRSHIEWQVGCTTPLAEHTLVRNPGLAHRGADADPCTSSVPNRWIRRRLRR